MKTFGCSHCETVSRTRRDFISVGSLGLLGITQSDYLRFAAQTLAASNRQLKAKSVIWLWLAGGVSQLDTWDVKGNTNFKPISTNADGVQICEFFPKLAKHMDKLSIIRSMKTDERDHPPGTYETMTGHRPNPALRFPSFGSVVAKEL